MTHFPDSLCNVNFASTEDFLECTNNPCVDFILAQLQKKIKKYFIAHIVEANSNGFNVKYFKKSQFATKFSFADDDVYELPTEHVTMKLGISTKVGGTDRRNAEMKFSVDLSSFNVE